MTSPTPQSERRRAQRALASFPVRFAEQKAGDAAVLRDISTIGLACTSPTPIAEMTLVGLDFALPGSVQQHHVKGAVVRCEPLRGGGKKQWDVAVYFTEIGKETKVALHNYVGKGKPAP